MHMLQKYRGKAKSSPLKVYENQDKNEHGENSAENDSDTGDENNRNCRIEDPFNEFMLKMVNLIRELAICCFIFVAYAAISNDPPKVSKAPAAYPFFPENSVVKDFYRGQILEAIEEARSSDFSFLMFYAPWDAQSQSARIEIEATANYLKNSIVFAAINCWQPGSECRNQYNKVYRWPVLIAYPAFGTGIQYNGPIDRSYMISFLQKLMKPIKKASENILDFEEGFVVAEINASPGSVEYSVYYSIALKYLEHDPLGGISFYIKPVKQTKNEIALYLWDQILYFKIQEGQWNIENILQWILKNIVSPSSWALPSGSKSLLLSSHLQPGPSLILFTPMNSLYGPSDYYIMLQEISYEYKICDYYVANLDIEEKRKRNRLNHQQLQKMCKNREIVQKHKEIPVTSSIFLNGTRNIRQFQESNINLCQSIDSYAKQCYNIIPQRLKKSKDVDRTFENNRKLNKLYKTSMLAVELDSKSMPNLKKYQEEIKCKNYLAAQALHPIIFESDNKDSKEKEPLTSLGCLNQSLNFIALNSLLDYHFAERLGIDLSSKIDKSAVVIVNDQLESHYIMDSAVTSTNIRKFIKNFTNNTLARSTNSTADIVSSTSFSYQFQTKNEKNQYGINIEELNSNNFLDVVLNKNKCVIVMYYSKQCSFCNGIAYTFLTLARKLSFVQNIHFTRIDGDNNIVPWEYTMEKYPTILFFPMFKKEETRVFPPDLPVNLSNLLGFILSNVDPGTKLHAMYSLCLHYQLEKDKTSCFSAVRNSTMSLIDQTLKDWRKSNNRQRQILLHNIKQLKQLHFLFTHNPENFQRLELYFNKLNNQPTEDYSITSAKIGKDEL